MSRITVAAALSAVRSRRLAALLTIGMILVAVQRGGQLAAQTSNAQPLPYFNGYLVTGNYVVGSVDLQPVSGGTGSATGTIHMSGVPDQADILAAWLYWETIVVDDPDHSQLAGVKFRDIPIDVTDPNTTIVKKASQSLSGPFASCYGSNGQHPLYTMYQLRADVRRFLPIQYDFSDNSVPPASTTKRLVNDTDLQTNKDPNSKTGATYALHTVTLPDSGAGNHIPLSAGASLVVVYRDTRAANRDPLRKIVFYDAASLPPGSGLSILPDAAGASLSQTIRGIYLSDHTNKFAKLTHIAGSGQPNGTDRIFFNNGTSPIATNPFAGTSSASDRSWADKTIDVLGSLMPGTVDPNAPSYGEAVTTTVDHANTSPYDCLAWGAIIFSTNEADDDHDGLPDGIEKEVNGLKDADGTPLPNLKAMGADPLSKDIFIEMTGMSAAAGTSYGSSTAPYSSTISPYSLKTATVTDTVGHNHLPTPAVIKAVVENFTSQGVTPHIDVGDWAEYTGLGGEYADISGISGYLVPSESARGGDHVQETACGFTPGNCWYPDFPGTVGWQTGFEQYADVYFDKNRNGLFHWLFYAHANGWPRSPLPCLDSNKMPTDTDASGNCTVQSNPNFRVPTTLSGVAQLPGSKVLITLGLWDKIKFIGSTGAIIGTTLHEFGHNLELYHGGFAPTWNGQSLDREPQCKPNHLSIMSYLFQISGLLDDSGVAHYEYSSETYEDLKETSIQDGHPAAPLRRRTAWYAPLTTQTSGFGSSKATRYCTGVAFGPGEPAQDMIRVDGPVPTQSIDWLLNGLDSTKRTLDVNFDGDSSGSKLLRGFNDWGNLRLDQTGGGKGVFGSSAGTKGDGSGTKGDGSGTKGDGTGTKGDGSGTKGDGSGIDGDGTGTKGDGSGTKGDGSGQDLTLKAFEELGHIPPNPLTACVIGGGTPACSDPSGPLHRVRLTWTATPGTPDPLFDGAVFHVYRWRVDASGNPSTAVEIPRSPTADTTIVDSTELPDNQTFKYVVKAEFSDGTSSGATVEATVQTVNDAPVANADNYSAIWNKTLTVAAPGVLANDTDTDPPTASLRMALPVVLSPPANGKLTPIKNTDGTASGAFTYTPNKNFVGTDSFIYKANDGIWTDSLGTVAMSPDSTTAAKVTITVIKK